MTPAEVERYAVAAAAAYDVEVAIKERLVDYALVLLETYADVATDSQAYAARDGTTLVLAFRGTESFRDARTDAEVLAEGFQARRFGGGPTLVHGGFLGAWKALAEWATAVSQAHDGVERVVVCGHSLGGAIATLAATDLWALCPVSAYTYGCPRVGLSGFASLYPKAVAETVRVVHGPDIVPRMPILPYQHVCEPLHLDDQGREIGRFGGWLRDVLSLGPVRRAVGDVDGAAIEAHHVDRYVAAAKGYAAAAARV